MNTGCLILAGGNSRRMGYRKSSLRLNGTTFLDKLIFELRDFPEILVSVDDAARHPEIPYSMIDDRYSDCGPMSGLYSALSVCESDALLVLPCDVPLFSGTLAHHLQEVMDILILMHLSVSRRMIGSTPCVVFIAKAAPLY